MIKNVLNKLGFVRVALVAGAGLPFIVASNAFAQAAPPPPPGGGGALNPAVGGAPAAEVERLIVTGSLIPTAEEVGANPVFSINRDLINKSGAGTTTEQLLQRQPVMNGANIPVNNNGTGQSGPSGTAALALATRALATQPVTDQTRPSTGGTSCSEPVTIQPALRATFSITSITRCLIMIGRTRLFRRS